MRVRGRSRRIDAYAGDLFNVMQPTASYDSRRDDLTAIGPG